MLKRGNHADFPTAAFGTACHGFPAKVIERGYSLTAVNLKLDGIRGSCQDHRFSPGKPRRNRHWKSCGSEGKSSGKKCLRDGCASKPDLDQLDFDPLA